MFDIDPPRDHQSLVSQLESLHLKIHQALEELPAEIFFAPQGEFWSPCDHLRHLIRSNRPVAVALGMPKVVLRVRFGKSGRPSRPYEDVVAQYHGALAAGGRAAGRFLPSARQGTDDASWRTTVFRRWTLVGEDLAKVCSKWSDKPLDRLQLPHPLIGNLTIREMLYFTLYHNHHHARRIFERLQDSSGS